MIGINTKTRRRTNFVPSADVKLSDWIRTNLPSCKDFFVTDIDFVLRSRKGCMMVIEKKCRMATIPNAQRVTLQIVHFALQLANNKKAPVKINGKKFYQKVMFKGSYLLQFENTFFDDGKVYFDGEEVTEQELINILSFADCPECC